MRNIKIKSESKAKRCEVCHQIDMFDEERETCLRCIKVENIQNLKNKSRQTKVSEVESRMQTSVFLGILVSLSIIALGIILVSIEKQTSFICFAMMIGGLIAAYFYCKKFPQTGFLDKLEIGSLIGSLVGIGFFIIPLFFVVLSSINLFYSHSNNQHSLHDFFYAVSFSVISTIVGSIVGTFTCDRICSLFKL